ncbi:2-keto-4-pentenoate hydratase [Alloalcanivorax sp. C16-1]|uniref:2-keto-4-pentenoate hydratase n=1 Tax=Alloalcanivorax sp. C16-1 TaxID=3390051 RepID=UPI00397068DD
MQTTITETLARAAQRLRAAQETGQPCPPVRDLIAADDLDSAYRVQDINSRYWESRGRRVVGGKIGLTARVVQQQLGVDQPDYGLLFADMAVADGGLIPWDQVLQPKVEAEVALVLARDLNHDQITLADLIGATDYVLPALEVVGSRIADWDITIADTVADNASCGAYVLGTTPRSLREVDLSLCGMNLTRRGEPVSVGAGAACLGNPLNAALWLANTLARARRPLRAGDLILTGALGPMVAARPGDRFRACIEGLGPVSVGFAKENNND